MSQGSQLAAVYSTEGGNTLASGYGDAAFATSYSSGLSTPIYKRTADVAVTVVMFMPTSRKQKAHSTLQRT